MNTIALLLGIWGTVLSSILAWLRWRDERVRIKVSGGGPWYSNVEGWYSNLDRLPGEGMREIILLKAVNMGKRPVTLTAGWIALSNGTQCHAVSAFGEQLPCKLEEHEQCGMWIKTEELNNMLQEKSARPVAVCFRDVTDRLFKAPYKQEKPPRETET